MQRLSKKRKRCQYCLDLIPFDIWNKHCKKNCKILQAFDLFEAKSLSKQELFETICKIRKIDHSQSTSECNSDTVNRPINQIEATINVVEPQNRGRKKRVSLKSPECKPKILKEIFSILYTSKFPENTIKQYLTIFSR